MVDPGHDLRWCCQAVLIVNPFATAVTPARLTQVEEVLRQAVELRTVLTERSGHATDLAREACDAWTSSSSTPGTAPSTRRSTGSTATIRSVSCRGRARAFSRARSASRRSRPPRRSSGERVLEGRARRISVGRVNGRRFGFSAGIGLDAELVRRMDALGRDENGNRPGDLSASRGR